MMKRIIVLCCITLLLASCGSKKKTIISDTKKETHRRTAVSRVERESRIQDGIPEEEEIKLLPNLSYLEKVEQYIFHFSEVAKNEMKLYNIPASITLAQGILESGAGYGNLTQRSKNHFGIKCHGWQGEKVYHDDDRSQECFRKYDQASQSFRDHSLFLAERKRYAALFKLSKSDYKGWAKGLKAAGYATDKKYPAKLISIIERYQLDKYDKEVLGKKYKKIKPSQKVELPKKKEEIVDVTSKNGLHTVKKGETLYAISRLYKISVEELKTFNDLKDNTIKVGQVLKVSKVSNTDEFDF